MHLFPIPPIAALRRKRTLQEKSMAKKKPLMHCEGKGCNVTESGVFLRSAVMPPNSRRHHFPELLYRSHACRVPAAPRQSVTCCKISQLRHAGSHSRKAYQNLRTTSIANNQALLFSNVRIPPWCVWTRDFRGCVAGFTTVAGICHLYPSTP